MNIETFEKYAKRVFDAENDLLAAKRASYARGDEDVLLAFKRMALATGMSPMQVCMVLLHKHLVSLGTAVEKDVIVANWEHDTGEGLAQRMMDARAYLLLLGALVEEHPGCVEEDKSQEQKDKDAAFDDLNKIFTDPKFQGSISYMGGGEAPEINVLCAEILPEDVLENIRSLAKRAGVFLSLTCVADRPYSPSSWK